MRDKEEFFNLLTDADGKDFSKYAGLVGDFDFSRFVLRVNQVQPSSDSRPTLFVVRVPQFVAGFPARLFNTPVRRTALEDFLARAVAAQAETLCRFGPDGLARRRIQTVRPGQKILPRSTLVVNEEHVEARLYIDLPARNGRVAGDSAKGIFFEDLPQLVNQSFIYCNLNEPAVEEFVDLMEDADQVRQILPTRGWVAFVGEGAMLPRQLGSDEPDYQRMESVSLQGNLSAEIDVPRHGVVRGLGIPAGVTLILGNAYSGRTELMRALAAGIYNHTPGDGREWVVTVPDAVHIPSSAGRSVQRVNMAAFCRGVIAGSNPNTFTSPAADGFASQAAATVEALEVGARVLLFDESDSSLAFLCRDSRVKHLLKGEEDVVIPLVTRARQIADELGVSVVVAGSSALTEFIPVADTVLRIANYSIEDITEEAKRLPLPAVAAPEGISDLTGIVEHSRWIVPSSIDPSSGRFDAVIESATLGTLRFGRSVVDLASVSQLADVNQTLTIGLILHYARLRYMDEARPIREVLDLIDRDLSSEGLECLTRDLRGDLTRPRRYEIAAALNRLATLRVTSPSE